MKGRLTITATRAIPATGEVETAADVGATETGHLVRQSRGKLPGRRAGTQQLRRVEVYAAIPSAGHNQSLHSGISKHCTSNNVDKALLQSVTILYPVNFSTGVAVSCLLK